MANPAHTRPGSLRPRISTLPDGRRRLVTFFELSSGWQVEDSLVVDWGLTFATVEKAVATGRYSKFADCRLVGGQEAQQAPGSGVWVWVREYEELHATDETQVGKLRRVTDENGRDVLEAQFVQLSSATETPGTIGTTTAPGRTDAVLNHEESTDDGAVRRITRRYIEATTSLVQVGKNRVIKLDDGRTAIEADFIIRSSASYTPGVVGTTTPPAPNASDAVMSEEIPQPVNEAVRRITRRYVSDGLLSTSTSIYGDDLVDVTWVSVRTKQSPTSGVVIRDDVQKPNGIPVYTVTKRQSSSGGAPSSAGYSYTTKERFRAPGRLVAQKFKKTIQSPGTIPNEFDYDTLLLYRAAPVDFDNLSVTVTVSWTTSNSPGSISPAVWDPQQWAQVDWDLVLTGPVPYRYVTDHPGYCVVADSGTPGVSARSLTSGSYAGDYDIAAGIGRLYGGGNTNTLTVRGPEYPEGESRTLGPVRFEPAWTALDGTRWYRKIQRVATLPTLPELPDFES